MPCAQPTTARPATTARRADPVPELPEVEVVRRGLAEYLPTSAVTHVSVLHPRALRRYLPGATDFASRLHGAVFDPPQRRGKFLWLPIRGRSEALVAHLGMSGQLLLPPVSQTPEKHLRVRIDFADAAIALRFVDQRTFGWLTIDPLVTAPDGREVPSSARAIAPDLLEPTFRIETVRRLVRARRSPIKAVLLDQSVASGIGNIYADEALWAVRRNWATPAGSMSARSITNLYAAAREVMASALTAGGTSIDALYIDVNGQSGYFERDLHAYGRAGEPCHRCGTPLRREAFGNRSSFRCPRCQRR